MAGKDLKRDRMDLLGRGTDALNFDEWIAKYPHHLGPVVRKEDDSNLCVFRAQGLIESHLKEDGGNLTGYGGSMKVKGGTSNVGALIEAGGSRSVTMSSSRVEKKVIKEVYEFRDRNPSFPTKLAEDLSNFLARQQLLSTDKGGICPFFTPINEENQETAVDFLRYISKNRITDYIFRIVVGTWESEQKESSDKESKIEGRVQADAEEFANIGGTGKHERKQEKASNIKLKLGRTQSDSDELAIIDYETRCISELLLTEEDKTLLRAAVYQYKWIKQRRLNKDGMIGPVRISLEYYNSRMDCNVNVYWRVSNGEIIEGTSKLSECSQFYLKEMKKCNGDVKFCIYYYKGEEEKECHRMHLVVDRSQLPSAAVAVTNNERKYKEGDFIFTIAERFSPPCLNSLKEWIKKEESVYISIKKPLTVIPPSMPKTFYIKMSDDDPVYSLSFHETRESKDDSLMQFCCSSIYEGSNNGQFLGADTIVTGHSPQYEEPPTYHTPSPDSLAADAFYKLVGEDFKFPSLDTI